MSKSLRSKRRRKMRAEKRIVNAKKELVKLKEVAAKLHGQNGAPPNKAAIEAALPDVHVTDVDKMSVDGDGSVGGGGKQKLKINNQWMNQRKIKSIKRKIKQHNTRKARKGKSAGLSSRKSKRR